MMIHTQSHFPSRQTIMTEECETEMYYHVGPETPTGCLIVLAALCLSAKQRAEWEAEGRKNTRGDRFVSGPLRAKSEMYFFCLSLKLKKKNTYHSVLTECRSALIVSRRGEYQSHTGHKQGRYSSLCCDSRWRQRSPVYSAMQRHTGWFP